MNLKTAPAQKLRAKRCYAAGLGNCIGAITSEHYVSRGILERLGAPLTVSGLAWSQEPVRLPPTALGSNILCKHHNSILTSLDESGIKLFECLKAFHEARSIGDAIIDGELIERWMFKLLFGFVASGNVTTADGVSTKGWTPPDQWNRILFGYDEMPCDYGLYFFERPKDEISQEPVEITVNSDMGKIYGVRVELMGFNFHVGMRKLKWDRPEMCMYRPGGFFFSGIESKIIFA